MSPMFSFRDAHQQEVRLPDGRRWTVRVERDDEPEWNGGLFSLNFWYTRWIFARLRRLFRTQRGWRVVVVTDAVVTSADLAVAQTAMLLTPSMGHPTATYDHDTREAAEERATQVFDELARTGTLPPA